MSEPNFIIQELLRHFNHCGYIQYQCQNQCDVLKTVLLKRGLRKAFRLKSIPIKSKTINRLHCFFPHNYRSVKNRPRQIIPRDIHEGGSLVYSLSFKGLAWKLLQMSLSNMFHLLGKLGLSILPNLFPEILKTAKPITEESHLSTCFSALTGCNHFGLRLDNAPWKQRLHREFPLTCTSNLSGDALLKQY